MMGEFGSVINFLYCSGRAWALQINPVRTSKKENIESIKLEITNLAAGKTPNS